MHCPCERSHGTRWTTPAAIPGGGEIGRCVAVIIRSAAGHCNRLTFLAGAPNMREPFAEKIPYAEVRLRYR